MCVVHMIWTSTIFECRSSLCLLHKYLYVLISSQMSYFFLSVERTRLRTKIDHQSAVVLAKQDTK